MPVSALSAVVATAARFAGAIEAARQHRAMDLFRAGVGAREKSADGAGGCAETRPAGHCHSRRPPARQGGRLKLLGLFGDYEQITVEKLRDHQQETGQPESFEAAE